MSKPVYELLDFIHIYTCINGLTYFIVFSEKLADSWDGNELWALAE
jgi:hypothetical protein